MLQEAQVTGGVDLGSCVGVKEQRCERGSNGLLLPDHRRTGEGFATLEVDFRGAIGDLQDLVVKDGMAQLTMLSYNYIFIFSS